MKKQGINWKIRVKNIYFWIAVFGVVLTAMGIKLEMLTSWGILLNQIKELIGNPFMLFTALISILGVINDPTTSGITDSKQALEYVKPKKDGDVKWR